MTLHRTNIFSTVLELPVPRPLAAAVQVPLLAAVFAEVPAGSAGGWWCLVGWPTAAAAAVWAVDLQQAALPGCEVLWAVPETSNPGTAAGNWMKSVWTHRERCWQRCHHYWGDLCSTVWTHAVWGWGSADGLQPTWNLVKISSNRMENNNLTEIICMNILVVWFCSRLHCLKCNQEKTFLSQMANHRQNMCKTF